jgi:hypothetical protein
MPSLNLRLSDELHASLVLAASRNGRSLQREIVMRLDGRVSGALEAAEVGGGYAQENRADGLASGGGATGSVTMKKDPGASAASSVSDVMRSVPGVRPASELPARPSRNACPADTPRGTRCKLCGEKH